MQHVVDRCLGIDGIGRVIVAADAAEVVEALQPFKTEVVLTSPSCRTGTERVAEVARTMGLAADDVVINVQGDEPEIEASVVTNLALRMNSDDRPPMATVHVPFPASEPHNPNLVKVVVSADGRSCLWFSRSPIPYARSATPAYRLHVGIYAYRVATLLDLATTPPTPAERCESLEQLRALETGLAIAAVAADEHPGGIDTSEQYRAFVERFRATTT